MGVSENGVYPQMAMIRAKVWERGFLNQPVLKYELLEIWRLSNSSLPFSGTKPLSGCWIKPIQKYPKI